MSDAVGETRAPETVPATAKSDATTSHAGTRVSSSPRGPLKSGRRTPLWHSVVERLIAATSIAAILAIVLIFVFIAREALPLLWEHTGINLRDLILPRQWTGYDSAVYVWQPVGTPEKFNAMPLLLGSLKVTLLTMLWSVPIAIGAATFISQYAPKRVRDIVKPAVEMLAGIPSVVLGFFALMVLATWIQDAFGFHYRLNAVVSAIALSLTVIPIVFTITEDALHAVPKSLREASLALGARHWQTTLFIVLPAALPGIAAAVILGFGRAIGETMVVLMASGNAAIMEPFNPATSVRTVTATIAAELGEVAQGDTHWRVLFMLGVVLFMITFVLNRAGASVIGRLHKKLTAAT